MSRPDSNSPDPDSSDSRAGQDDAVWLDLVARLEGRDQAADPGAPDVPGAKDSGDEVERPGAPVTDGVDRDVTSLDGPASEGPGTEGFARRPFSDFDPLGLSAGAPIELSAEERLAQSQSAGGTPGGSTAGSPAGAAAADASGAPPGPRDYAADDGDPFTGEFVPEEPPSLAGADPMTVLAWLGAVGGPVALVMSAMFWRSAPLVAILGMVAAFAASVVFLIMKLPGEKDEHDDGARL
ncbi:hypothetical protein [Arthrobacter sp. Leaf69]|uniref:hypothetical protein n=1 Tax=Arthrobacter sp. Leaf69 TaxID=1736232 RepID=UPI0006FF97BA|nr:hypothetical protein [Arthrobacter sp. Leaf69]KQN86370.1 hypothetical protein ASE96_12320 [Arthrobacter sp. Leaf69]